MRFSQATVQRCWQLAQGRCECQRGDHDHAERCNAVLMETAQGLIGEGGWFAWAWTPLEQGGPDAAENAEALCWRCYQRVVQPGE